MLWPLYSQNGQLTTLLCQWMTSLAGSWYMKSVFTVASVVGVAHFKFKNPFAKGDRGARRTRQQYAVSNNILKEHRQKWMPPLKENNDALKETYASPRDFRWLSLSLYILVIQSVVMLNYRLNVFVRDVNETLRNAVRDWDLILSPRWDQDLQFRIRGIQDWDWDIFRDVTLCMPKGYNNDDQFNLRTHSLQLEQTSQKCLSLSRIHSPYSQQSNLATVIDINSAETDSRSYIAVVAIS